MIDGLLVGFQQQMSPGAEYGSPWPEMEFLGIDLAKDPSLLLHAIHSLFLLLADFKEIWF